MPIDLSFREIFDCTKCKTPCDGKSKSAFDFEADVAISECAEIELINRLQDVLDFDVRKVSMADSGLPDLEIRKGSTLIARIEVKAQGRAFMAVSRLLPNSNLRPYETVALNRSDLLRYISTFDKEMVPTFIVWKIKRPCIPDAWFGQDIKVLKKSYQEFGSARTFKRRSTASDLVDGIHKGVTVNYHFSLKELLELPEIERFLLSLS